MLIRLLALALMALIASPRLAAQETYTSKEKRSTSPFSLDLELASRYIWRGQEYGDGATFFPKLSYTNGGFKAYALGCTGLNGDYKEVNLGVQYQLSELTMTLANSYSTTHVGQADKYLNFSPKTSRHSLDFRLMYEPNKIPFWFFGSCFVYGNDRLSDGSQAYSSYLEVGYRKSFLPHQIFSVALGATPNKSFYTNYERSAGFVNVTLQYAVGLQLGKLELPVSVAYTLNPQREKSYVYLSLTLKS